MCETVRTHSGRSRKSARCGRTGAKKERRALAACCTAWQHSPGQGPGSAAHRSVSGQRGRTSTQSPRSPARAPCSLTAAPASSHAPPCRARPLVHVGPASRPGSSPGLAATSGCSGGGVGGGGSHSPRRRRSTPAQATMAPLSVHSAGGGATSANPCVAAAACRARAQPWAARRPPRLPPGVCEGGAAARAAARRALRRPCRRGGTPAPRGQLWPAPPAACPTGATPPQACAQTGRGYQPDGHDSCSCTYRSASHACHCANKLRNRRVGHCSIGLRVGLGYPRMPRGAAGCRRACKRARTAALAATPPETTRWRRRGCAAAAQPAARRARSSRCATATRWNEAAMSARTCAPAHAPVGARRAPQRAPDMRVRCW